MIRRALTTIALASAAVVLLPGVAVADNCSGLQDCYGSAGSAAGAAAGMALVIGLAVLAAPALLRGAGPESRPGPTDDKPPSRAPGDGSAVEVPGVEEVLAAPAVLRGAGPESRPGPTDDTQPIRAPGDGSAVEVPGVEEEPLRFDEKVRIDMAVRGWTPEVVAELARHPARTFATWDRRYNLDGSRASQPATVFVRADGLYVVINNVTHDVVQVGAGPLGGTHTGPTDPSWTASLRGRVATLAGGSDVRFAGPEPCYPVRAAPVAIDWCFRNRVCVLGLEGLVLAEGRLVSQLDTILDCSAERNPGGAGTVAECAKRARTLIRQWSAIEDWFVILTLSSPLSAGPAAPTDTGSLPKSVPWWQLVSSPPPSTRTSPPPSTRTSPPPSTPTSPPLGFPARIGTWPGAVTRAGCWPGQMTADCLEYLSSARANRRGDQQAGLLCPRRDLPGTGFRRPDQRRAPVLQGLLALTGERWLTGGRRRRAAAAGQPPRLRADGDRARSGTAQCRGDSDPGWRGAAALPGRSAGPLGQAARVGAHSGTSHRNFGRR